MFSPGFIFFNFFSKKVWYIKYIAYICIGNEAKQKLKT